jgi:hypothetical protein
MGNYYLCKNTKSNGVSLLAAARLWRGVCQSDCQVISRHCRSSVTLLLQIWQISLFRIACTNSRLNESKLALEMLNKSFEKGYDPGGAINTDPDLQNIQSLPEFKEIAKRIMSATKKTRPD